MNVLQRRYLALLVLRRKQRSEIDKQLAAVREKLRAKGQFVPRSPYRKRRFCDGCGAYSVTTKTVTQRTLLRYVPPKGRRDGYRKYRTRRRVLCERCRKERGIR